MYDAALAFLRAHGGLLNAVKPEMLLPAEDLARVLNTRANQADDSPEALEAVEQWGEVEISFATVSVQVG
ncbi:uncharacterized protein fap47 [Haematococcus lacustris]|uniref:Uncharacterized protein fap47 n=1 Tax=Haematococcus lacustris TaxID=44745 RepID=A0A699YXX4_HAELA|nr:uncharacterized protein fap47 [Haematococcus lacustris]